MEPSKRRVKKGPGRRPQSAKRQRFMELRARGWTIAAAGREVGASRSAASNWAHGYKTYRNGQAIGFVEPLDRLTVKAISSRYLSQDERIEIADFRQQGSSVRAIAHRVGRAPSTVSRELHRNARADGDYRPFDAHRQATARRAKPRLRRLETNLALRLLVGDLLAQRWSPAQIARHLHAKFPHVRRCGCVTSRSTRRSTNRTSWFAPSVPSPLTARRCGPGGITAGRSSTWTADGPGSSSRCSRCINARSPDRSEAGHWEGDLIVGRAQGSVIGTLVERRTRTIRLLHLPTRDAAALHAAVSPG